MTALALLPDETTEAEEPSWHYAAADMTRLRTRRQFASRPAQHTAGRNLDVRRPQPHILRGRSRIVLGGRGVRRGSINAEDDAASTSERRSRGCLADGTR